MGIGQFVVQYIATVGFIYTGEHTAQLIRERYLAAILKQNVAFFDKLGAGEITTRITSDMNLVQDAISQKVSLTLTALATFVTAFIIGFAKFWKLTLICSSSILAIILVMSVAVQFLVRYGKLSIEASSQCGSLAEEAISSIRNATAFGTQDTLARQYESYLADGERWGFRLEIVLGAMTAALMSMVYMNYGLGFWMGSRFLVDGSVDLGDILTILLSIIMGSFSISHILPYIQAFSSGVSAAGKIYSTIGRESPIDPTSDEGDTIDNLQGVVELEHVNHIYPSRPEVEVMKDVNLVVPAGKVTALVGPSGSGKSTIVGLLERFYNPTAGSVKVDGKDVRDLNIRWLRQQISLVSQEPTLFSTTVEENIRYGLLGSWYEQEPEEKIHARVVEAARIANAHDFVSTLPEGYETKVGERGFLLSGGQKQRIAIARAVISDPKILLLDEATSALDTKSEGVVQAALDVAAQGRTTIVIAHRLSTIKTADNIVVLVDGDIIEQGTHQYLLGIGGMYSKLVEAQTLNEAREATMATIDENSIGLQAEVKAPDATQKASAEYDVEEVEKEVKKLDKYQEMSVMDSTRAMPSNLPANQSEDEKPKHSLLALIKFTYSFNRKELPVMLSAFIASMITGGGSPTQSVFFAKAISTLALPPPFYHKLRHDANFWSLMFFIVGLIEFVAFFVSWSFFGFCAERLLYRSRSGAFRSILRQDIAFFDREENSTGALTSFLSTETKHISGISGTTLGTILMVATTLIACIVISVSIGWKLGLVCVSIIPVLLACGYLRFHILALFNERSKRAYESSASYACEATSAIRTVASLTREKDVMKSYHAQLEEQSRKSLKSAASSSTLYAASQGLVFCCNALGFWYGGTLLAKHEYTIFRFFLCYSEIIFGAQSAGIVFSFAPDMGKAKAAATELKRLFDRRPTIDTWSDRGEPIDKIDGAVELHDIHFRYPNRPEQPVLSDMNLTIQPGQYVALVGASGCGKSTIIGLLERFYDPFAGKVLVDGRNVATFNVNSYRKHLALVSQEPTLYQGTIRENILLGLGDHGLAANVSDERIEQVCRQANIYDFIISLPYSPP